MPVAPITATRVVTEPLGLPATMPSLLVPDLGQFWIREQAGGLLFGGDYQARPHYDYVDADPPHTFTELPLDGYEETRELARTAARLIPLLERFKSATVVTGAPVMTPDFRPIAGRVPGLDGAWVITGDCEAGITHGPGLGRTVAEHICGQPPTLADPAAFDPGRFGSEMKSGADVVRAIAALPRIRSDAFSASVKGGA
jgi:glycine/D-amino acid oxidase-like deaminating enzyme